MAGEALMKESKPLASTRSTIHDKRNGVAVAIEYAALAKYEVNVRSFHPNKQFEPEGFRFHGDDRGFSLGESYFGKTSPGGVTSRIWQRYTLDTNLEAVGRLTDDPKAKLEQESNPSDSGPGLWSVFGSYESYESKEYKPRGTLTALHANTPHGGQKDIAVRSWYGGENHAFILSRTAHNGTGKTPVPTLDVFSDLFIKVERVNLYIDILSLVYGDGFPNCEAFIQDSIGNKLFLGTHVRLGVPATHLAGANHRLMWANALRVEIDKDGNFGKQLWVFRQVLGGPPALREKYPPIDTELWYSGTPVARSTPLSPISGFAWNYAKPADIPSNEKPDPLHLSAFFNPEEVREMMEQRWQIGPTHKMTRTQWNASHQHRNPNDGRGRDSYDVSPEKWMQPS